ncbi:hypothetical protein C4K11_5253 [Pseudomonas chlororaphis subsp. aureofaciens]|nr:hypothetical protein C4K14_5727 [Pseudomonas chlororaphis subsp. aureofaciens]AZD94932.1 hypothetical protein C4K13_5546 [Pseudomonas chlororaphis subsp. aureofaciens]AZE01262.1 hypothetical protein C4K12_5426 [Pseudomonas chlororaphis subsp. aureofaciens]AZE07384.1 hypothetical protein C4K11_5253 [Pseudomonas chlororaphis subsp. aureofaciens]
MLCLGGHEMDRLYSCNPLRRIAPSPTHAGPATASGRTYQIKSDGATPGCRARVPRRLQRSMPSGLVSSGAWSINDFSQAWALRSSSLLGGWRVLEGFGLSLVPGVG